MNDWARSEGAAGMGWISLGKDGGKGPIAARLDDARLAKLKELAGVDTPKHVQFNSLLPLATGKADQSAYDAIYGAYLDAQRAVTVGQHKLILYPSIKKIRLYDLKADPQEMRDLAEQPESAQVIKRLFARLLELQQETGDTLELAKAFPELAG